MDRGSRGPPRYPGRHIPSVILIVFVTDSLEDALYIVTKFSYT